MTRPGPLPTCRFAPSPNGPLHLGHAYSALRNAVVAGEGRLLLRMENIDQARCSPAIEGDIAADLAWLGLAFAPAVRRQSEHLADYGDALGRLGARGLVYPCTCTRGAVMAIVAGRPDWPRDPDGAPRYPGTCRHRPGSWREAVLRGGEPFALRLDMAAALALLPEAPDWTEYGEGTAARRVVGDPAAWGDAVLRRKDIPTSYHVAVVVDDAVQGVTDVVRGRDLFAATALHRVLQYLLDLPAPRYHHHRLVLGPEGDKLSKSRGATSLSSLRAGGVTPAGVLSLIAERLEPAP